MIEQLFALKPIVERGEEEGGGLKRTLGAFNLTALGIGAVIGAGIFVIAGKGAQHAGPAIMISFMIAGFACLCAALCYAELAAMIPAAGSAYTYVYSTMGELIAWIIGWNLILEYMVASAAVAAGWGGYLTHLLENIHVTLPYAVTHVPYEHGVVNLPGVFIALVVTTLLAIGVQESARVNSAFVILKVTVLVIFMVIATPHVQPVNWHPFMPFGFNGVMTGAALIFFAYIGFDAVSTTAEEAKNPQRDLPIGIIASLLICTVFYILVAAIMTGMVPFQQLNDPAPLAKALNLVGEGRWSILISVGAIFGLSSVLVVLMMGLPRVWYAMSRDGLLPKIFAQIHPRFRTPIFSTLLNGAAVCVITGFVPIDTIAELTNIGTLSAFIAVSIGVLILRYQRPELKRSFRAPLLPLVSFLAVVFCAYLMKSLPMETWRNFGVWLVLGVILYFVYGRHHSAINNAKR